MAVIEHLRFKVFLFVCGEFSFVVGQYNQFGYPNYNQENPYSQNNNPYPYDNGYNNPYNNPNPYNIPNPGDRDYRTYVYKGRRYGQSPNIYNDRLRPGNPQIQGQDEHYFYDPVCKQKYLNQVINFCVYQLQQGNGEPILPGILAGWRPDLQGKLRPQTKDRKKDVFVQTTHGQVQGFLVFLFDNPDPDSLYRPGSEFIEREQGVTEVYLGIPYAEPPIVEGRFKVQLYKI